MFNCFRKTLTDPHYGGTTSVKFTKGISIEIHKTLWGKPFSETYGFVSDVAGTGEPGILMHGSPNGKLMARTDLSAIQKGEKVHPKIIIESPFMLYNFFLKEHNINLKKVSENKPLHFICCYSNAKMSMAQNLANYLNRPVISYGKSGTIYTRGIREIMNKKLKKTILIKKCGFYFPAPTRTYTPATYKGTMPDILYLEISEEAGNSYA